MVPPTKSSVWKHFLKQDVFTAKCKICHKALRTAGNTTNLRNHLNRKHPGVSKARERDEDEEDPLNLQEQQQTSSGNISTPVESTPSASDTLQTIDSILNKQKSYLCGGKKNWEITKAIVRMIAKDIQPMSIVENEGFQHLLHVTAPLYKIPNRKKITAIVDEEYEKMKLYNLKRFQNIEYFSLTTDIWTDTMNTKGYLGMTIHYIEGCDMRTSTIGVLPLEERHTAEYLQKCLENILKDWALDKNKMMMIVTDNGANIVKAVTNLLGKNGHLPCFAHTMNLVSSKAIEETTNLPPLNKKIKSLVTFIKQSVNAADSLRKLQLEAGVQESNVLKLIQEISTRWNSTFFMLERFIQLSQFVSSLVLVIPKSPDMVTGIELTVLREVVEILRPIEQVTRELSADKYTSLSKVIPLVYLLRKSEEQVTTTTEIGSNLKANILKQIERRFDGAENTISLAISTICDPRFKKLYFSNPQAVTKALSEISKLIRATFDEQEDLSSATSTNLPPQDENSLWRLHDQLVKENDPVGNEADSTGISVEVKQYLNQPVADRYLDPLHIWETYKNSFPNMYKISRRYLSTVATSVPSERLFSKAGNILTEARNRMAPKRLGKLLFLNSMSKKDWDFSDTV